MSGRPAKDSPLQRVIDWTINGVIGLAVLYVLALLLGLFTPSHAAEPSVRIPHASALYRLQLERVVGQQFGLDAPVARLAAQIHQESHWRPDVASKYAQGLAQFTPPTAKWLPNVCPGVGPPDPWDADWSLRAIACYDKWLYDRVTAASECDRWSFTLSAYNGGLGWVRRDQARASAGGADPARWFGHTDAHSARAGWAFRENRSYVARILHLIEPAYSAAGWPGAAACGGSG